MADTYSSPAHPFDFPVDPEPEPPALSNGHDGVNKSSSTNGTSNPSRRTSSSAQTSEDERTWTSLTLPGAILNSTVYVIGKTIELLAPYWPNSQQRQKAQSLAKAHPVLTSFLIMQIMFVLVPVVGFAAFVVGMAVLVVGAAVLFVIGVGLGVGVMVFIPGVLVATGWAVLVWSWAYVAFRATKVAWQMYRNSPYYRALSQGNDHGDSKRANGQSGKQLNDKPKKANTNTRQGSYGRTEEEKRPTSTNSLASSTVKVGDAYEGESRSGGFSEDDDERAVKMKYTKVLKEGERDEDNVGRDIMRSLG